MTGKTDYRVRVFRNLHERELRQIITIGCAVAGCVNDGDSESEDAEMNELAKKVMELVDKAKRSPREKSGKSAGTVIQLVKANEG